MKGEKIAQLELILKAHPEGLRKSEIARRIGVHRSTIGRYLEDLKQYRNIYEKDNLIKIEPTDNEEQLALSVYESLALNMGAEVLLNFTEFKSPHLASGLRKIAISMQSYAPKIAKNIVQIAEEAEKNIHNQKINGGYNSVFEILTDAWTSGKIVRINHTRNGVEEESDFAPYFIGFVDSDNGRIPITVTGRLRHTSEIITIDISDINSATVLEETYTIPDNLKVFKKTDETVPINSVIDTIPLKIRIREKSALNSFRILTHGDIQIEKQDDSWYECTFRAENSIELTLRILQCTDSIEIIEPEFFRKNFIAKLKHILEIYE